MNCENCGLPEGCYSSPGEKLTVNCEQKYKGCRRTKVIWVCSASCATQQRAISEMGPITSKWPITLAEFAGQERAAGSKARSHGTTPDSGVNTPSGGALLYFVNKGVVGGQSGPKLTLQDDLTSENVTKIVGNSLYPCGSQNLQNATTGVLGTEVSEMAVVPISVTRKKEFRGRPRKLRPATDAERARRYRARKAA